MNKVSIRAITIVGLSLMLAAVSSWAGPPPNNDSSLDGNTAGGTNALGVNGIGEDNSAWGASALDSNSSGMDNTAIGFDALRLNVNGNQNTSVGSGSLENNSAGSNNTATGFQALFHNTSGFQNTASGAGALLFNSTGHYNAAIGAGALYRNTSGSENTASGGNALGNNTSGNLNTASGEAALAGNTSGGSNSASGFQALFSNTIGSNNTANGAAALQTNVSGISNTADGSNALFSNTTGSYNSAFGFRALFNSTTGQINTALGYGAGVNVTTGSNNIEIANAGSAGDTATIRIGLQGTQTQTYIAGIAGSAVTGSDVVVNSSGKLGVVVSSARYKRNINDMGSSTDGLMKLRPVTFTYKSDPQAVKQYGLVAEEVDKVYPELVVHDDAGKVESVRYSMLTSMLLNLVQKQQAQIAELKEQERLQRTAIEDRLSKLEQTIVARQRGQTIGATYKDSRRLEASGTAREGLSLDHRERGPYRSRN